MVEFADLSGYTAVDGFSFDFELFDVFGRNVDFYLLYFLFGSDSPFTRLGALFDGFILM